MTRLQVALAATLVLQLAAIVLWDDRPEARYAPTEVTVEGPWFPDLDPAAVRELVLERGGRETRLRREGERWVVASEGGAPADRAAVEAALGALASLEGGVVVSENPAKFRDFGVEGEDAITVEAFDESGKRVAALVVGHSTADWRSTYLRRPPDAPAVVWLEEPLRQLFDRDGGRPGAWQDRTVTDLDPLALRVIEIRQPGALVVIERVIGDPNGTPDPRDRWRMVRPVEGLLGRYQGQALAETVAHLVADAVEVGIGEGEAGLAPPAAVVVGRTEDGREVRVEIGSAVGEEDRFRYVRPEGGERVFRVATYRLLGVLRDPEELLASGGGGDGG